MDTLISREVILQKKKIVKIKEICFYRIEDIQKVKIFFI